MDEMRPRNVRMTDAEWQAVEDRAKAERMATGESLSRSDIVRKAIEIYLKTEVKRKGQS